MAKRDTRGADGARLPEPLDGPAAGAEAGSRPTPELVTELAAAAAMWTQAIRWEADRPTVPDVAKRWEAASARWNDFRRLLDEAHAVFDSRADDLARNALNRPGNQSPALRLLAKADSLRMATVVAQVAFGEKLHARNWPLAATELARTCGEVNWHVLAEMARGELAPALAAEPPIPADSRPNVKKHPRNPDVRDLCTELADPLNAAKSQAAVAREFVKGSPRKAASLLRQCREKAFRHLWWPRPDPKRKA